MNSVTVYDRTTGDLRDVELSADGEDAVQAFQYMVARAFRSEEWATALYALRVGNGLTEDQAIATLYDAASEVIEDGAEEYLV